MLTQPFSTQLVSNFSKESLVSETDTALQTSSQASQMTSYYKEFKHLATALLKNQYLHQILGNNEVLFYRFVQRYFKEVLPILYTPTVGQAVQAFHHIRSHGRGLYISWAYRDRIEALLEPYSNSSISIAILTDGERILGLGDQGVGGIEICTAKAMMYVVCGRLPPHQMLPIYLDVGTNNPKLLKDPDYRGWRHARLDKQDYDDFIDKVVVALRRKFPNIYLHWEDLERDNANRLLERYQNQFCTFNDDIQGTGVVTLASALTAMKITQIPIMEQRIVIFGGGTAGLGIADQLCGAMQRMGLARAQAQKRIWLIGRYGLLFADSHNLTTLQKPYARPVNERVYYESVEDSTEVALLSVINYVKPNFLVGCSGKAGAFTQDVITKMAQYVDRPIIFPLSNPTAYCEAIPQDILRWTENRALVATGSPFEDVMVKGEKWAISQCNNALAFPGIGLGIKASGALRLTEEMTWEACLALCEATPCSSIYPILLPDMKDIHAVSEKIADKIYTISDKSKASEKRLSASERIKHIRSQYWLPLCHTPLPLE